MSGSVGDYALAPCECELVKTIALFPERVRDAIEAYEPSIVTRYILDLCAAFNGFYHDLKIVSCEDECAKAARIALTEATNRVLKTAMGLICLSTPERI